jgi:hypothetical protein
MLGKLRRRASSALLNRHAGAARRRLRPALEWMEPRALLATFSVNTPQDLPAPQDGLLSLRAALGLANQTTGHDSIVFDSTVFATRQTISLASTLSIASDVTIDGPDAGVVVRRDYPDPKLTSPVIAVAVGANATVHDLTVTGGRSSLGGGFYNEGTLSLVRCTIHDNQAGSGGGVYNASGARLDVSDSTFANNRASYNGGAIYNDQSRVVVIHPPIPEVIVSVVSVANSTFSGNRAQRQGGAIYNASGTSSAKDSGSSAPGGNVDLTSVTVSGNKAAAGGGLTQSVELPSEATGHFQVRSSIVAGNLQRGTAAPDDVQGPFESQGYNVIGAAVAANGMDGPGDQVGTAAAPIDPRLGPLADNGGPTKTMALLGGSPALYGGDTTLAGTTDQRGVVRPSPQAVGAFQPLFSLVVNTRADTADFADMRTSLREAIASAASPFFPGADTITFDPAVFGTSSSITLDPGLGTLTLGSDLTIDGGSLGITIRRANTSPNFGIVSVAPGVTATLCDLRLTGGAGFAGSGVTNQGDLTVDGSTIVGNITGTSGGGILNFGELTVVGTTIAGNTASLDGGGIGNFGTLTLSDSTVQGNSAGRSGGGLLNAAAAATGGAAASADVTRVFFQGNSAAGGGGISNGGTLVLARSTLAGNSATTVDGGGLDNQGSASIRNSTFSGDRAAGSGGAISFFSGGTPGASLSIVASTVAGNLASSLSGGIYSAVPSGPPISMDSTIVANNRLTTTGSPPADLSGTFLSSGYNVVGTGAGATGLGGVGDQVGTASAPIDPRLGPLADNGGPTQTMALLNGSPALYAGDPTLIGTPDQRGVVRPPWPGADVGAYQRPAEAPSLIVNTTADAYDPYDNRTSLREAIAAAGTAAFPGPDTITFDPVVFASARTITTRGTLELGSDVTIDAASLGIVLRRPSTAASYGIVQVDPGVTATLRGLTLTGGSSDLGGGILNFGNLAVSDATIRGNSAKSGGGIGNFGALTLSNSTVDQNTAKQSGGGLLNASDQTAGRRVSATVVGVRFRGNVAAQGGGIGNESDLLLLRSTVADNTATVLNGGGIDNTGTASIGNCTITGNTAAASGGAISFFGGSPAASLSVLASTVAGNSAGTLTGGIYFASASGTPIALRSTIVAGNSLTSTVAPPTDVFGPFSSGGFNLVGIGDGATGLTGPGDRVGTAAAPIDPRLGPLADNGGPTQTMALLDGSPALLKGDPALAGTLDQRGVARPAWPGVDAGAYQRQAEAPSLVVNTAADVSSFYDNRTSLREALAVAGSPGFPGPDTITFDPTVFATARTITLDPSLGTLRIATDVTIDAPAAGVSIARNDVAGVPAFRPISVAAGVTVTLDGLTVRGGRVADDGGGLLNLGNLTIRAGSFRNNSAGGDGGAIANRGTLFVATSSFLANAAGGGGAVANAPGALATIQQSSLSGNAATGLGGGLWNSGTASVGASLLDSNSAASGGGAYNAAGSTLGVVNSTLHGNRATGQGGGLANFGTATVTLSTIARNRATQGGGVLGDPSGDVRLSNSLIALNTASPGRDVSGGSGAFTSLGHNLVGVAGVNERFGISTDLFGTPAAPVDPLLSPLGAYGGPTQTVALLPGSPAIDAADPAYAGSIDQRGVTRNVGSAPDIGAFESRGFGLSIVSGSDQSATVGAAFAAPLVVSVSSAFGEPVAGGLVDFAAPTLGASASLSTRRARIAANGQASDTATANDVAGTYQVLASTGGAGLDVSFRLTNDTQA